MYEDKVKGKLSDERFEKLCRTYETEQATLKTKEQELIKMLAETESETKQTDKFMKLVKKYTDIEELTAEIVRTIIEKIIVYEAETIDGERRQKIKIIYNCVGSVDLPQTGEVV